MSTATSTTVDTTHELTPVRWLAVTLGLIATLAMISITVAWRMDVFGIFRDPRGRSLVTSEHERKAKYLLNQAYVPANFNALIIGASASVNWRPELLTGYRFYNESIEGGDASEQRKLVEQALPHGHFDVAIVGLYPRITALHVLQDGFDKAGRAEVLGSISAFGVEYDVLHDWLAHRPSTFTPDGSHSFTPHEPPPYHFHWYGDLSSAQDPVAVADYRGLVEDLKAHGTRIVYIVSPLFEGYLEDNRATLDRYLETVHADMPVAPIIDFNDPQYAAFRSDNTNYLDVVHLSASGAAKLSRMIDEELHKVLAR